MRVPTLLVILIQFLLFLKIGRLGMEKSLLWDRQYIFVAAVELRLPAVA
jgi:hypothetical protein